MEDETPDDEPDAGDEALLEAGEEGGFWFVTARPC
jgi:hypothetical protein